MIGTAKALVGLSAAQGVVGLGKLLAQRQERARLLQVTPESHRTEVSEIELPTDETVVQPGDGTNTTQEVQEPAKEVLPDLGIEWLPRTVKYRSAVKETP